MIGSFLNATPHISESCFVAEPANAIGDVTLGDQSGIWYNITAGGDPNRSRIGFVFYSKGHTV